MPLLNDLLAIERGLTANGINQAGRHSDIKDMAKGGALRVRLDAQGNVSDVELVEEAGRGAVWTLRDGQHNGFPGLKTVAGLLLLDAAARADHDRIWIGDKSPIAHRNELLRLLAAYRLDAAQAANWPNAGHRRRIAERLGVLDRLRDDPKTAAVPATFERFLLALDASPSFIEQIAAAIATHVRDGGDEWLEPARGALLGPFVALTIDVAEDDFDRDAGDLRQVGPVSLALSSAAADAVAEGKGGGICALTGQSMRLHAGNFPQPNLPGLGQTYIFSRNMDIPALRRYGRSADASFAIGSDLVSRLAGAITVLTCEVAKGRSWRLVPAETGDKPDLLIASLPAAPDARLADAIAGDDEIGGEGAFFELTSRVLDQSQGLFEHEHPQDDVVLMVLRAVDPANRKAIYHRRTTATNLHAAAKNWGAAKANTPDWLGFPMPAKAKAKDGKAATMLRRPPSVTPLSIVGLSRVQFANGGRRRVDVIGTTAATAFGLFLREGDVSHRATALLRLVLQRHGGLLAGLAAARSKGIDHLKDFDAKTDLRRDALRSTTWIGILLHSLNRSKEIYMSDAAFRLGQLLAAADAVHIGYCADMRDGDIPPTLIGNAVLSIAGANPIRALSILQSRWKPYGAWASEIDRVSKKIKSLKGGKDNQLAWNMRLGLSKARRIALIAAELAGHFQTLDLTLVEASDTFKAELLLGYMAGLPPLPKKDDTGPADDDAGEASDGNKGEAE